MKKNMIVLAVMGVLILLCSCTPVTEDDTLHVTAVGHAMEGALQPFLGEPFFESEVVFEDEERSVREPYLAIAVDGSILALRNRANHPEVDVGHLRRSKDGGQSWGDIIEVPFGFLDTNFIVDETTGDLLVVRMWDGVGRQWRSNDHGQIWQEESITLRPNEVMKWLERSGLKERSTWDERGTRGKYMMHANASESGITLRHGENMGRLIVTATFRPHAPEHPSDRDPVDKIYSCAIYSDDGGSTWQVSGLFPEGTTEEAALAELSDGRIYYNSRSGSGYYDESLARELRPDEVLRREAWSYDNGRTWQDLRVSNVLVDGGGYDRGYGLKGGLTRLPVQGRDVLLYSNTDTGGGEREKMTVWASFDGGDTWPVKSLVYEGPSAYSSMDAGRPGTPSEGMIYMLFEGGPDHHYEAMQVARFNLSWLLEGGEMTGDGTVPEWVQ